MPDILLKIEGMTCDHCVAHGQEALFSAEGVNSVDVSCRIVPLVSATI